MTLGPLDYDANQAIRKQLRIMGYHVGTPEWDGALAAARAHLQRLQIPVETPEVTVKVSRELLGELAEWSEPVQVMVEQVGGEYTMIARRPGILVELTGDRAPTPWARIVQLGTEETISDVPHRCMRIRLSAAEMGA